MENILLCCQYTSLCLSFVICCQCYLFHSEVGKTLDWIIELITTFIHRSVDVTVSEARRREEFAELVLLQATGESNTRVSAGIGLWRKPTFSTYSKTRYSFPLRRKASFSSTIFSCLSVRSILSSRRVVSLTSSFSAWRWDRQEMRITLSCHVVIDMGCSRPVEIKDEDSLHYNRNHKCSLMRPAHRERRALLPSLSLNFLMATISLVSCSKNTEINPVIASRQWKNTRVRLTQIMNISVTAAAFTTAFSSENNTFLHSAVGTVAESI